MRILLRSQKLQGVEVPDTLLAVARAGAGREQCARLIKYSKLGIVVFNTPGANANAVKELVMAGMLLATRERFARAWPTCRRSPT
jgi:D-3-phosphoglycerate dehydrogenase